ncbi:MAG: SemiSWEET transporter [Candidatus Omnitrophica bacterium]|nr:SemiSWEET transporter [Candidatus Omnitrophota bacterium]
MTEIQIDTIGLLGGFLTTVCFIPQIIKILKTGHVRDISLYMYVVLTTGIVFWLIYGLLLWKLPIILANSASFILCFFIVVKKLLGRKDEI